MLYYAFFSHFKMLRVASPLLPSIAICILFLAYQGLGSRLSTTIEEVNDPGIKDLFLVPIKQNLTSLKANSDGIKSEVASYLVAHRTSAGGPDENYYGLSAITDVYGHDLKKGQTSNTVIWVHHLGDGDKSSLNSIQVGWHIYPERCGDSRPHLFAYWTRDGYETTGCYNMDCPGFVPAKEAKVSLGAAIDPVSRVHGRRQNVGLKLFKCPYYGFNSVPTAVGYYPRSLFTYLAKKANVVSFGAYVETERALPTPPMGSGASPNGDHGHPASFTDLQIFKEDGTSKHIMGDLPYVAQCYGITPIFHGKFFYGGPRGRCG